MFRLYILLRLTTTNSVVQQRLQIRVTKAPREYLTRGRWWRHVLTPPPVFVLSQHVYLSMFALLEKYPAIPGERELAAHAWGVTVALSVHLLGCEIYTRGGGVSLGQGSEVCWNGLFWHHNCPPKFTCLDNLLQLVSTCLYQVLQLVLRL